MIPMLKKPVLNISPLAAQLRPSVLSDIIGQSHLIGEGKPITLMAQNNVIRSCILWGPSGTGKTSLVLALSKETDSKFHQLNATESTVKELRAVIADAQSLLPDRRTIVFVDEIHRWNKSQQDTLLPHVENGVVILFGATTEKPKFAVNTTLLSRCIEFELKPLDAKESAQLILKIKNHYKQKSKDIKIDAKTATHLINKCSGDARKLIVTLEMIIEVLSPDGTITNDHINAVLPNKHVYFDKSGNDHFDIAHCYQEAIQNSDVDSALYWLAKWIESGEDPAYICRRMIVTAFEDCAGNPFAPMIAMAASYMTERVGLPECAIAMSYATCEMSKSDRNKSAYYAISKAMSDVKNGATIHVPPELRAGTSGYVKMINKIYLDSWTRDAGR